MACKHLEITAGNGREETVYGFRRTLDGSARNLANGNSRISLARALAKIEHSTVEGRFGRGRKSASGVTDGNWDTAGRRDPSFGDNASHNLLGAEHASKLRKVL